MFHFRKPAEETLDHWTEMAEGFQTSSNEFYQNVEKELDARKIPDLYRTRIDFKEGGFLSSDRQYLRLSRERLVFDICAATFGTGFFFSCRLSLIPIKVNPLSLVGLLFLIALVFRAFIEIAGFVWGTFWLVTVIIFCIWVLRNTIALGLHDLDGTLVRTPLFGPLYEAWFRKDTYYRIDSRLMYLAVIPKIVRELAEQVTAAKGVKLVKTVERAPLNGSAARKPDLAIN